MRHAMRALAIGGGLLAVAATLAAKNPAEPLSAQSASSYPSRPITLVVTFPPGGGTDLLARRLGSWLERDLGQPVVIENRAGASGNIGAQAVARSPADGYTLLMVNSSYAVNPGVFRDLGFSPERDLKGVVNIGFVPSVLVTSARSPWNTLGQVLDDAALQSDKGVAYASCGNGTPQHLAGEMLDRRAGGKWLHVPYRGCGPALTDVLAGNVPLGMVTASAAMPFIHAGNLRALAVTAPKRSAFLPEVPTVAEQGFAGYELDQWHGVLAPAATPAAIIDKLSAAANAILQRQDVRDDLRALGYSVEGGDPKEFQGLILRDIARFAELTGQIGLRID
ncbi:tripartite tricarboxylate transporter substrate binding protein [Parapusillimonas sp. JC17]|uniref:tripartite tricarboxylate transporter substrate binding protein n=1 Tax=Parapusillimonas sp. JC17 TaxID=3445768 RepID=UPI003FA0304F